jgi:hypothetical protein
LDQEDIIVKRDQTIGRLEDEINRLKSLNENSGMEAGELSRQLTDT